MDSAPMLCPCHICELRKLHGLSPVKQLSEESTSKLASVFAARIFESHRRVKNAIDGHRDVLLEQWRSKDRLTRAEILRSALPGIPNEHRPDFAYMRGTNEEGKLPFEIPQLNVDDLCTRDHLIVVMVSRTGRPPAAFVESDAFMSSLKPGVHFPGFLLKQFQCTKSMLFWGQDQPETYGALHDVDDLVREGKDHLCLAPYVGLPVMQYQAVLMKFLADCCAVLLPGVDLDTTPGPLDIEAKAWNVSYEVCPERIAHGLTPQFPPDEEIDVSVVRSIVDARITACQDHICTLISDTEYFLKLIRENAAHVQKRHHSLFHHAKWLIREGDDCQMEELAPPLIREKAAPVFKKLMASKRHDVKDVVMDRVLWAKAATTVLREAHGELLFWRNTDSLLNQVEQELVPGKIDWTRKRVPKKLEQLFRVIELSIASAFDGIYDDLCEGIATSVSLKDVYQNAIVVKSSVKPKLSDFKILDLDLTPAQSRIHQTFVALSEPLGNFHSEASAVEEAQRMLRYDADAAALPSDWTVRKFSEYAVLIQLLVEIDRFQPWSLGWLHNFNAKDFEEIFAVWRAEQEAMMEATYAVCLEHTVIADIKSLPYPVDSPPSDAVAAKQRMGAERSCDRLIHAFYDTLAVAMKDHSFITELEDLIGSYAPPARTQLPTKAKTAQARKGSGSSAKPSSGQSSTSKSITEADRVPSDAFGQDFIARAQAKVRNASNAATAPLSQPPLLPAGSIEVDHQAWACFDTIFQTSDRASSGASFDRSGGLSFQNFCKAMQYIGLLPAEVSWPAYVFRPRVDGDCEDHGDTDEDEDGGSANETKEEEDEEREGIVTPTTQEEEDETDERESRPRKHHWHRSFTCNAPHPQDKKWSAREIRILRGRLTRAYGMHAAAFVRAEQSS